MTAFFVRNENGRGIRATERGIALLRIWDVASWIVVAIFFGTLLVQGSAPWWLFVLVAPFGIAPLVLGMLFTGRGPIGALLHYGRQEKMGRTEK